ncbi:hypothetical protein KR044_000198 [Drosophila immigrans]|nr:hypothetical protein KR044_000198 [Drosophila immigrans]
MPPKHRDVSPFLQLLRDFLLGRKHVTSHRHAETLSPRSLPPHKPLEQSQTRLSGAPYYSRDARCQVKPPIDLVEQKKREDAVKAAAKAAEAAKAVAAAAEAGAAPKAEAKPAADSKDCKQDQTEKEKSLPTPGQMHKWD